MCYSKKTYAERKIGMNTKEVLFSLSNAVGVSGDEEVACIAAKKILSQYTKSVTIDDFNSVIGFIGDKENGKPTILLDAHIDEVGLVVSYIDDNGFIRVSNCGSIDRRVLAAQPVTVWGVERVRGVISTLPPHVKTSDDKAMAVEDIVIDTGYSKKKLETLVRLGDRVVIDSTSVELSGTKVSTRACDDRSGMAAIIGALELLKNEFASLSFNIAISFSSQEELGERGAEITSFIVKPAVSIAVDVSFAYTPGEKEYECGKLGKGAMIGFSPALNRGISDKLLALAKEKNIAYQIEVMGEETGTNADIISTVRGGVKVGLLSIPEKYMHMPVGIVDTTDIDAVSMLIAEFIRGGADNA